MDERKYEEFKQILLHLPFVGVSIKELASALNVSMTLLYNYRNGVKPKEQKYNYIMARLQTEYAQELETIHIYIQRERELEKGD